VASSLEKLEQSHPVEIVWRSFELRPGGAPMPAEYQARVEAGRPRLQAIARQHYGIELNSGPLGVDSRPALVGAKYAESTGNGPAYHKGVLEGYWLQARNIGDLSVLADIAVHAGLERQVFLAALEDAEWIAAVDHDIEQARVYGLSGVPALVLINKYLVSGAQPYETLVGVVEQIQEELAQDSGE
jgi:predicted DsbA family dithiol-disulfide isomerase